MNHVLTKSDEPFSCIRVFLPHLHSAAPRWDDRRRHDPRTRPSSIRGQAGGRQNRPTLTDPSLICVDPLVKVFRDATDLPTTEPEAHVAVGEFATLQFAFRSPAAVADLKATVSREVPDAAVRYVGYVKVGRSYGGAPADVLKSADRTFPDPLLEDKSVAVAANQNQPIWITVPAKAAGRTKRAR